MKKDNEKLKITVVIPVYNVEDYLMECVYSILNQTYTNLEIILIDDGSTDNSGLICDNLAIKDRRIKVVHKKNEGVSKARNIGIDLANGDVIAFIDADDFLEEDMFDKMIGLYEEKNMVVCSYNIVKNNKKLYKNEKKHIERISVEDAYSFLAKRNKLQGYTWNKLFSATIIKQNKLKFIDYISICEDICFVSDYMLYIKEVIYIRDNLYNYRLREGSASNNKEDLNKKITMLEAYKYLIDLYEKNNIDTTYLEYWLLRETLHIKIRYLKIDTNKKYIAYCQQIINTEFCKLLKSKKIGIIDKIKLIIRVIVSNIN